MKSSLRLAWTCASALSCMVGVGSAQTVRPLVYPVTIEPADLDDDALYGAAVGVDGDRSIVGAPGEDSGRGAIYIHEYVSGAWNAGLRLQASDGQAGDQFGASVAIVGSTVFVGAPGDDDLGVDAGAVYVYQRIVLFGSPIWVLDQKVFGSDTAAGDRFGSAVAAQVTHLVVGAPNDNAPLSDSGSAYGFENVANTWTQTGKIVPSNPQINEHFGTSVDFGGNRAVIGSPDFDNVSPPRTNSGRAVIVLRDTSGPGVVWSIQAELNPLDPVTDRRFGASVAIDGTRVLVGATGAWNFDSEASGAGYVFDLIGTWTQKGKLLPSAGGPSDDFGQGVALLGQSAYLASSEDVVRFEFVFPNWPEKETLEAPFADLVAAPYAELGSALATSGIHLLVGRKSAFASDEGALLAFHNYGGDWNIHTGANAGSNGFAKLRGAGPLVAGTPLTLRFEDGKPLAPATLLIHLGPPSNVPYANGTLRAFPFQTSIALPLDGSGEITLPTVTPAGLAGVQIVLQMLVADANAPLGVGLSNGLEQVFAP